MDLVHPVALWLLLLVAILLLLARQQTARVRRPVGNLYMWARSSSSISAQPRFRRLRQHWIIILQAAIIAAAACALARPLVSWSNRPVALIVDVTASMGARDGGGTRMDLARQAAFAAVSALPRRARVRLFVAGRFATDGGEFSPSDPRLTSLLQQLTATPAGGDLARAVRTVRGMVGPAAAITVISDRREPAVADAAVTWVVVGSPAPNQAITTLAARRLPEAPADGQVITTITNHAASSINRELELTQDAQVVFHRGIELPPRRSTTVVTDIQALGRVFSARLMGDDALPHDDVRSAIVPTLERIPVRLVTQGSFFLERALATNPNLLLQATAADTEPREADVVVCDRCPDVPAAGRAVLMIRHTAAVPAVTLSVSLPEHPIAAALDLGGVTITRAHAPPVPVDADVVLRAGPHPVVTAHDAGSRRVVDVSLDLAGSFALHPAFPVLLDNALGWLVGRGENATEIAAGEPLRWRLRTPYPPDSVVVTGPQGRNVNVTTTGQTVTATDTGSVGVYTLRVGGDVQPLVVNPVTDGESDLSGRDTPAAPPSREGGWGETTARVELAPLLLLLAFLFLGLEWRARVGRARVT